MSHDTAPAYRALLESMVDGVFIALHRRFVFANSALLAMLGYTHDEFVELPFDAVVDPEFLALWNERYDQRVGLGPEPPNHYELRFLKRGGTDALWVELRATRLLHRGERSVLGIVRDITDRRRAEQALREAQKMESLGTLAGGIAHEFNNALGAILGNVELARTGLGDTAACRGHLDQIAAASLRAKQLVRQILEFSHRQPHTLVEQPLRRLVEDALGLLRTALPAGVRLDSALTESALPVRADTNAIQQVIMSLCTNAWQALEGRGGRIEVGLAPIDWAGDATPRPPGLSAAPHAHLWVADSGRGMDRGTLAHLFEPFFTTRPVGEGTGLGLASVRGIVLEHHGAVTVESTPGTGSCFHVYLPLRHPVAVQPVQPPGEPTPDPARTRARQVMCVDDDEIMLLTSEGLLRRAGYRVITYSDPREALAALRVQPAATDLVVTDYNMPGLSGLDVAREVAGIRGDLPVVISSGYVTAELRAAAQGAGVAAVFNKEDSHAGLSSMVDRVLAGPAQAG